MKRALIFALLAVVGSLAFPGAVLAQQSSAVPQNDSTAQSQTASATETTFNGSWRVRTEVWNWFQSSTGTPDYVMGASVLRLSLGQKRAWFDWQIEAEQPTLFGNPEHATAPAPQGALGLGANYFASNGTWSMNAFLRQTYVRFHPRGPRNTVLTLGRFEFIEGAEMPGKDATVATLQRERIAHRLVGNFGFSEAGRTFDGATFSRTKGDWNLTATAARTTRGVFQTDGWGDLDVDIQYAALTRSMQKSTLGWRVFGLGYHDGREVLKTDNRSVALRSADHQNIRIGTLGGNLVKAYHMQRGTADFLAWGAYQFGSWGILAQRASAGAVEAGYQLNARSKPWLRVGYFRGSGGGSPNDRTHGTFFQVLPTPRVYARFPFFNLMNNEDAFAELSLSPARRLKIRTDGHTLKLSNAADLWYQGGGAYDNVSFGYSGRISNGKRSLANLFDVSADVELSKTSSVTGYAGFAAGKSVIAAIYPRGRNAAFAYLEMNYKF